MLWSSFFVTFVAENSINFFLEFIRAISSSWRLHRCAAMPLTLTSISGTERLSNPIRKLTPPLLMLTFVPGRECDSCYSCAGAHGCKWYKRILPPSDTMSPLSEIHISWCIRFFCVLKYLSMGALSYRYPALLMLWAICIDSQNSINDLDVY